MRWLKESDFIQYKKSFICILVSFLIIVIFSAGILYQKSSPSSMTVIQNAQPTHAAAKPSVLAWKTYKDEARGFSFQYPRSWYVNTNLENNQIEIRKRDSEFTRITFDYYSITAIKNVYPKTFISQKITVGNETAVFDDYFTGLGEVQSAHANLRSLDIGHRVSDVTFYLDKNNADQDLATIKKILASFKLLE